jgi:hypothetical protein
MVEATNDLLYEVLKVVQRDIGFVRNDVADLKLQMHSVRGHLTAIQQDVGNIYSRLGHLEDRVERVEVRLGLVDPAH